MRKLNRYLAGFCVLIMLAACSPNTERFSGGNDKLATQVGVREGGVIKASGQPGFLVYGPYVPLEPGGYRLVAKGNLSGSSNPLGFIDVAADKGRRIAVKPIVAGQSAAGDIVALDFEVTQSVTDAEFRLNISAQTTGSFAAYELTKVAKPKNK